MTDPSSPTTPDARQLPVEVQLPPQTLALTDLAGALVKGLSDDELVALVKRVDELVEDWDFTLQLAAYFEHQHAEFEALDDADDDPPAEDDLVDRVSL